MENTEKKIEQVNHNDEKENVRQQRLDAQDAAEKRIAKMRTGENFEATKSIERKSLAKNLTPDEAATLRSKHSLEGRSDSEKIAQHKIDRLAAEYEKTEKSRHSGERLEELAHAKNLTLEQRKELEQKLGKYVEKTDPYSKEADRLTEDGLAKFEANGNYRRDFSHLAGSTEHTRWEDEIENKEEAQCRKRGVDFELEAVMKHPDGKPVRLDYVDYEKGVIIDRKSLEMNETEEQLKKKYEGQRRRHIEAYEHTTGKKVSEYNYSIYPSPRDI